MQNIFLGIRILSRTTLIETMCLIKLMNWPSYVLMLNLATFPDIQLSEDEFTGNKYFLTSFTPEDCIKGAQKNILFRLPLGLKISCLVAF